MLFLHTAYINSRKQLQKYTFFSNCAKKFFCKIVMVGMVRYDYCRNDGIMVIQTSCLKE